MVTSELRSAVVDLVREAGRATMVYYDGTVAADVREKDDRSPVTLADEVAHRILLDGLRRLDPATPVVSEEAEAAAFETRRGWRRFWLVDPLDGTKEFIKRNGQFTVNIALIREGRPLAGVVLAPAIQQLYYALEGHGAFKIDAGGATSRLEPASKTNGDRLVIAGSLSHPTPEMDAFVAEQRRKYKQVEFLPMGSSLKICLVAEGAADLYPRFGPTMEWDTAAAHAVAREAGRKVVAHGTTQELPYNKQSLLNGWFVVS